MLYVHDAISFSHSLETILALLCRWFLGTTLLFFSSHVQVGTKSSWKTAFDFLGFHLSIFEANTPATLEAETQGSECGSILLVSVGSPLTNESFPTHLITLLFVLGVVGIFVYANLVYTPEIMQGASLIRQENREMEILKLISAVKCHIQNDQAFSEIRDPLETVLGMSLEEYIQAVDERRLSNPVDDEICTTTPPFGKADQELANMFKSALGSGT